MATGKQRILVTGGTGYIGSHTTVELLAAGFDVVIIDNLSNSNRNVLDGIEAIAGRRPDFVEADCTDLGALEKLFADYPDIAGIINFAASKAVGESVQKPLLYYRNNLTRSSTCSSCRSATTSKASYSRRHAPSTESLTQTRSPRTHPSNLRHRPTATQSRSARRSSPTTSPRARLTGA